MRSFQSIILIIPILLLIDLYTYKGLMGLVKRRSQKSRIRASVVYLTLSLSLIALFILFYLNYQKSPEDTARYQRLIWFNAVFLAFFVFKLFYIIFEGLEDLKNGVLRLTRKRNYKEPPPPMDSMVSRRDFIRKTGVIVAALPFLGVLHGVGWGRFRFTVHHSEIKFPNLPEAFHGLRIVQLSDAHLGGFYGNSEKLEEVVSIIDDIKPDLLLFTGDMVNNFASEMEGWTSMWSRMNAPMGKYAILGNHDYGDYSSWPTKAAKKANLDAILKQEEEMGFRVLRNENVAIERNNERIYLAGVENWGLPPFKQYGDLNKAMTGIPEDAFVILMSHNPDHWVKQVNEKTQIPLTLAGHTHGFQFGLEIGNFKISPVQLIYKYWAGLYKSDNQYLYVNRGLGYLAFPGRVGIWPEITLIEMKRG
ncbi:MAG: metallophosphoesterase [Bacteroidales bacterium]